MANLNFQAPPRSIANSSMNSRGGGSNILSGTSLSGHVTPTSAMFQPNSAGFGTQSQLSPNRGGNVQLSGGFGQSLSGAGTGTVGSGNANVPGRTGLFALRSMNDRRQMPSLGPGVSAKHPLTHQHRRSLILSPVFPDVRGLFHAIKRVRCSKQQLSFCVRQQRHGDAAAARSLRVSVADERARQRLDAAVQHLANAW